MIKKLAFVMYIVALYPVYTQDVGDSYISIYREIKASDQDTIQQRAYLKVFLKKARLERNWKQIVRGYKNYLHRAPIEQRIAYADSMIYTAIESKDTILISSAYLTKGIVHYSRKEYEKALDYYLIANDYLSNSTADSPYLRYKIKYNIGHIKYYLEQFKEALTLLNECLDYFKKHNDKRAYLNTLHYIGLCHNRMFNYGQCSRINLLGIEEGERLENKSMAVYFRHSEGINQYFKKNYNTAIDSLKGVIKDIADLNDFANVTLAQFYLGKSYMVLGDSKKAIPYLKMVDQSFSNSGYIKPELQEAYLLLMDYYKATNDPSKYLYYINRLIKVDSVLITRNNHLFSKINREYSLANIKHEKQKAENLLEIKKRNELFFILGGTVLLILLLWYAFKNYHNKKAYRKRYEELMSEKAHSPTTNTKKYNKKANISDKVEKSIIKQLERFETNHEYLGKHLTRFSLAASFNTNASYLSQIIKQEKGKKFSDYVNELKVDYAIALLKEDKIYRNYTIKALSEEVGFSSMQRFVKSFKAKLGMPPSYFIKELMDETSNEA